MMRRKLQPTTFIKEHCYGQEMYVGDARVKLNDKEQALRQKLATVPGAECVHPLLGVKGFDRFS